MYDKLENWKWYSKETDIEEKIKKRSCGDLLQDVHNNPIL